jgi:hypothetical protein
VAACRRVRITFYRVRWSGPDDLFPIRMLEVPKQDPVWAGRPLTQVWGEWDEECTFHGVDKDDPPVAHRGQVPECVRSYTTPAWLKLQRTKGKTVTDIARECGVSAQIIDVYLKSLD